MKNEEKANQLVELTHHYETGLVYQHTDRVLYENLIEMAEWKEQQMIEKACKYIYSHAHVTTFGDIRLEKCSITQFIDDFRKAMEE